MSCSKKTHAIFTEIEGKAKPAEETILNTPKPPKFIAIASGKGGVGKSTVSVNLAVALARLGKRVGLVDADVYGPSIPSMMNIKTKPTLQQDKAIPVISHGVKVMSTSFLTENDAPVLWRGSRLGSVLDMFFEQTKWGALDFLILDLPPGTGDIALDINQRIPKCKQIIVTTPHYTASTVAKKAGIMSQRLNHEIIGVVENMSYIEAPNGAKQYIFGEGGGQTLADELDTMLLAQVPLSQPQGNTSEPTAIYPEMSDMAELFGDLAIMVMAHA